jgi:intein/homing endonuclease
MKVLCLFDYLSRTGFGTVSKNIVHELRKHYGKDLQLDIIAINYFGEPFKEDENTYVISARLNDVKDDPFGRYFFLKVLKENDYDGIFIMQDLGVIVSFMDVLVHIKQEKKDNNKKVFKSIFYTPVDCNLVYQLVRGLEFFDVLVTYTEFARKEINRLRPELKVKVIPHGNSPKDFYPEKDDAFRKEYFGENADKFIITNINRNQSRKDFPNTIFGFIEAKKEWNKTIPEPFLYLHTHPKDPMGWDIRAIMLQTDLVEDKDYKLLPKEYEEGGCPTEILNKIYNASDVHLSTTLGEGWGMCIKPFSNVLTKNGTKYIKDIQIGDYVLGNDGKYHKVIDKTNREVNSIYKIDAMYGYQIETTEEHPYFCMSNNKTGWIKAENLKQGDYIGIVKPNLTKKLLEFIDLAEFIEDKRNYVIDEKYIYNKYGYSPKDDEWSYSNICKKYTITKKVAENAIKYIMQKKAASKKSVELAEKMLKDGFIKAPQKINRFIKVDEDLLEIIGLYLADGCMGKGRLEFCLNTTTKKPISQKVESVFKTNFGISEVVVRKRRNANLDVRISSSILAIIFGNMFGIGNKNKRIPELFFSSPKNMMPLIKGLIRGDGHTNLKANHISLSTQSNSLAYQTASILAANNILISVNKTEKRNQYSLLIPNSLLRRYLDLTKQKEIIRRESTRNHKPNFIETETHFFVPIKSIQIKKYKKGQEVYDLCVEGSHSFVANGIVCHNTYSEAAACKLPVIAPYSTSLIEMSGYGKNAFMLETLYPIVQLNDNIIRQQTDIFEIAEQLNYVAECKYKRPEILEERIKNNYNWIRSLTWKEVCKRWIEYFKIF